MLKLSIISKGIDDRTKHLVIGIKVKDKGESIERDHLFPYVCMTSSGTNVELWTKFLTQAHLSLGEKGGPSITHTKGNTLEISKLDHYLHKHLISLFEEGKVPPEIKVIEDITEIF